MEPNESGLSSYYAHQRHQPQPQPQHQPTAVFAASLTNRNFSNTERAPQVLYPHSVPSAVETVRRKRGRPRKYGTPEQAAAAKRMSSASAGATIPKKKRQQLGDGGASSSSKKNQLDTLGNAAQGFTPHIISVDAGDDVYQKIMLLMQQSKRETCILSASGSISNPSLRQPATSGGIITYEGQFDILSLSGSYIHTALGGRTGGLSVCLSSTNGQIIGGGIGGPLKAAGPVQVIVGTFLPDARKDVIVGATGDAFLSKLPSPVGGASVSGFDFRSGVDSSARIPVRGSEDPHSGSQFVIQPRGVQVTTSGATDWIRADARSNSSYELTGRAGHGAHESSENGAYEQLQGYD
ncbi:AT-hook motif nuclear-localized protein 14-like [Actinidia eriantha]|uniref:AT-hook motif nuclear-localized protein 14-like n=1 Tax=Actinidia eriantha TaxID=165200 RepID=UPI00258A5965|nr:AT-hook motif nuclear-localized protein 14-like [Actinidia eriantha]